MRKKLTAYFIFAYLFSWAFFIPLALQNYSLLDGIPSWFHFLGAFGPLLSAFLVTGWTAKGKGIRDLLERMTRWRVPWIYAAVALLSPTAAFLIGVGIDRIWMGTWQSITTFGSILEYPTIPWAAGWIIWVLSFGLGEETGWRGYALPRLQSLYSARKSSLILGLIWAGWHLPIFFYSYPLSSYGLIAFLIGILSGTAFLTWLYNSTQGSVLMTILWHGTYNAAVSNTGGVISAVVTALVILTVIFVAHRYGPETFSPQSKHIRGE